MDKIVAARMEQELSGTLIAGWTLAECIGHGKSALVFRATRAETEAAVKVFDRELVERFGRDAQRERILREKSLVGRSHPNLIEVYDSGEDAARDLFFVVMALLPGKNLAQVLPDIPYDRVPLILEQLASAARFLEASNLVHRDIKPENIAISSDFAKAVLLDLGVLRPIGSSTITDHGGQLSFIGTLQYGPPEMLHRTEKDSPEGWRAVTFYQLGAVLHDLLTRKPLFADHCDPYPRLVEAVSHIPVSIHAPGAPPELRMLAQDCLVKDPEKRLLLVNWERFDQQSRPSDPTEAIKHRIAQRRRSAAARETPAAPPPGLMERQAIELLRSKIERALRDACKQSDLPPFTVSSDSSSVARVRISFGPSRGHALTVHFAVYVEGKTLDAPGDIIQVAIAAAAITDATRLPETAPAEQVRVVFQAVQADDVLARRLTQALLASLDQAQELSEPSNGCQELSWMPIVEAE